MFVLLTAALAQQQTASGASAPDLDKSVDPCADFYAYSCRKWQQRNPIPPDQPGWGRFDELTARSDSIVRGILEKYSAASAARTPLERQIGDYYEACMDESGIENDGIAPLNDEIAAIAAAHSKDDLARLVAQLHRRGVNAFFRLGPRPDFRDATQMVGELQSAGMAVPDRNFYLRRDRTATSLRNLYLAHVQRMFELLGDSGEQAESEARSALTVETGLAVAMPDHSAPNDPGITYRKMTVLQLAALSPSFRWSAYFKDVGLPADIILSVADSPFFEQMDSVLQSVSLEDLQTYLRWQAVHASAALLPAKFMRENFNFFEKALSGTKAPAPRWKQCERLTTADLGDAVGQKYVEAAFNPESRARVIQMVATLQQALEDEIRHLPWMAPETKEQALQKLAALKVRIGYPEKWRDYSGLQIRRGDALGNWRRAREFEFQRRLSQVGHAVDPNVWSDPPTSADSSYNDQQNSITFPAGVLQPPLFDPAAGDAWNYGAIGALIGHELTHGFDAQGSRFDSQGNVRDWWTPEDKRQFGERSQCMVQQYSEYPVARRLKLDGKLTLDENVADNGGLRLALAALLNVLANRSADKHAESLSQQQVFFVAWASMWCQNRGETYSRELAVEDSHSPGKWRVNGVVSNMPEFQQAFRCKPHSSMVRKNACRVW